MDAKDFRKVILFMANQWSEQTSINIFGERLGSHIFSKWVGGGTVNGSWYPDLGTMTLFYELDSKCLSTLLEYINNNYEE